MKRALLLLFVPSIAIAQPNGGQVTRVVNARVENDVPSGAC